MTNDDAAAGEVGEIIRANSAGGIGVGTSSTNVNIASISLTPRGLGCGRPG